MRRFLCAACVAACGRAYGEAPEGAEDAGADAADGGVVIDARVDADADADALDGSLGCGACPSAASACTSSSFTDAMCPPEWKLAADPGAVASCDGGSMRLAASNTLDVSATVEVSTPISAYALRVAMSVTVAEWKANLGTPTLIGVTVGNTSVAAVRASTDFGMVSYSLCAGDAAISCVNGPVVPTGKDHRLVIDVRPDGTAMLQADCASTMVLIAGATPLPSGLFQLRLGTVDANPVDARFDDVLIAFTPSP